MPVPRCATGHAPDTASSRKIFDCAMKFVSWRAAVQVVLTLHRIIVVKERDSEDESKRIEKVVC